MLPENDKSPSLSIMQFIKNIFFMNDVNFTNWATVSLKANQKDVIFFYSFVFLLLLFNFISWNNVYYLFSKIQLVVYYQCCILIG